MKLFATVLITCLLLFSCVGNTADLAMPFKKIIDTSWMEQATLKYGYLASICLAQTATGFTEGYHWTRHSGYGGTHVVTSENYHIYETVRRGSWALTGLFIYANWKDADISFPKKLCRIGSGVCYGRDCFEWAYRGQRYGNPFDYTPDHNRASMIWFGWRGGKFCEISISTGPFTGPLVDIGFLVAGKILSDLGS